jgi:hypothetical protein
MQLGQKRQGVGTDRFQSTVGTQLDEGHGEKEEERRKEGKGQWPWGKDKAQVRANEIGKLRCICLAGLDSPHQPLTSKNESLQTSMIRAVYARARARILSLSRSGFGCAAHPSSLLQLPGSNACEIVFDSIAFRPSSAKRVSNDAEKMVQKGHLHFVWNHLSHTRMGVWVGASRHPDISFQRPLFQQPLTSLVPRPLCSLASRPRVIGKRGISFHLLIVNKLSSLSLSRDAWMPLAGRQASVFSLVDEKQCQNTLN